MVFSGFCSSDDQPAIVNIIVYGDFVEPMKTYDSLVQDFNKSELTDSIKIVGRPISVPAIKFKIDTLRVKKYGVEFKELDSLIKNISDTNFDINKSNSLLLSGHNGAKIPLSALSEVILQQEYYKPEIFIPTPACFSFKNECVAKVELFCRKKNMKKLITFIQENMQKYTADFANKTWSYEIVKNKLQSETEQ